MCDGFVPGKPDLSPRPLFARAAAFCRGVLQGACCWWSASRRGEGSTRRGMTEPTDAASPDALVRLCQAKRPGPAASPHVFCVPVLVLLCLCLGCVSFWLVFRSLFLCVRLAVLESSGRHVACASVVACVLSGLQRSSFCCCF